jgi:hypothetical protein
MQAEKRPATAAREYTRYTRYIRWLEMPEEGNGDKEHGGSSPGIVNGPRVISYNLSEEERPDGIKVRYKIRVATGKRAREIDARQTAVIMEVLQWLSQHPQRP